MSASALTVNELLALPNVIEAERKQRSELEARLKTENDLVAELLHDLEAKRAADVQKDTELLNLMKLHEAAKARIAELQERVNTLSSDGLERGTKLAEAEHTIAELRKCVANDHKESNRMLAELQDELRTLRTQKDARINKLQDANSILECQLRASQTATAQVMQDAKASAESVAASAASAAVPACPEISAAAENMAHVINRTEISAAVPAPTTDAKIAALQAETADLRKHMHSVIAHLKSTGAYLPGHICKDGLIYITY